MRYINASTKLIYYMTLWINIGAFLFLAFVLNISIVAKQREAVLIISALVTADLIWLYSLLPKIIYMKIDLKDKIIVYGNLFSSKKVGINSLENIKSRGMQTTQNTFTITLSGRKYKFVSDKPDWVNKWKEFKRQQ